MRIILGALRSGVSGVAIGLGSGIWALIITSLRVPYHGSISAMWGVLGGSWDLVSTVISTLSGVTSNYKYSYLNYNPSY